MWKGLLFFWQEQRRHPCLCIEFSASCVSFQLYEILEFMSQASLMAQMVKNLPTMQETLVQSLGQEDPLEEGVVTHSSILAWRIPMDRGARQATVHWVAKSWTRLSD